MTEVITFPGTEKEETINIRPWVVEKAPNGGFVPVRQLTEEEWDYYWDLIEAMYDTLTPE